MELQYIVLTIIKILISVPAVLLIVHGKADAAALIGGHVNNNVTRANSTGSYDFKIDLSDTQEIADNSTEAGNSEEIPNPSRLIVPGYNLPENIFNKGKPFYLEKDPLTGSVDFESKGASLYDDEYEYEDEVPTYDKSNIDRKDGPVTGSHKSSDINQLTPNFHDFLNLPVKYNPDKYVYPLISSSYANTKVQGNTNKHMNHKNYVVTTYKPTLSPTYFSTKGYYNQNKIDYGLKTNPSTVRSKYADLEFTTKATTLKVQKPPRISLMNSPMNHPSFNEEFRPSKLITTSMRPITEPTRSTTPSTTTKRAMSLFEQLFGSDYDETTEVPETTTKLAATTTTTTTPTTTTKVIPPKLFSNLPGKKKDEGTYELPQTTTIKKDSEEYEYDYDYVDKTTVMDSSSQQPTRPSTRFTTTAGTSFAPSTSTTTATMTSAKVTSLPLGENHVTQFSRYPAISTPNLREQLIAEKVLPPANKFTSIIHVQAPSTSNVHIAPDQDTVSFVVGNHQNVDGGAYVGTSLKESPYDNNPFRPVYNFPDTRIVEAPFTTKQPIIQGSRVTIQPLRNSEASLSIGVPVNGLQVKPGHVVDDQLEDVEFTQGAKIVFPDERNERPTERSTTTHTPDLSPPPPPHPQSNKEVLKLASKPMFHQLPSDLTPPEKERIPPRLDRIRPPWDPRPGHFHAGRPEYARPPRPTPELYKRIDNLPNILPQFRPNMKVHHHYHSHPHHHHNQHHAPPHPPLKNFARQPLLERPSNRPIGFFEKLLPPPQLPQGIPKARTPIDDTNIAEDRAQLASSKTQQQMLEPFAFLQAPPKITVSNRRSGEDPPETLQMIQAKKDKKEVVKSSFKTNLTGKDNIEKPLYVVYPVNTPPLKLDAIDTPKKESVVIGTRAELPLPPSKISQEKIDIDPKIEFNYEVKERHDAPILKPRPGSSYSIKSDFPYPMERPDPSILNPEPSSTTPEVIENNLPDESIFVNSNQWNTIEDNESHTPVPTNQISVTLKTHSEKPIAVAYTPTESSKDYIDRFSMPNYGSYVIPEIRPESNSEITLSAVMHARPQTVNVKQDRVDEEDAVPAQDFQAPFLASAYIDHSLNQGWSVVRKQEERSNAKEEVTTLPVATTSEFDIENFKPQLEGGFKPIYSYPEDKKGTSVGEREE